MSSTEEENGQPAQLPMVPDRVRQAAIAELDRLVTFVQSLSVSDWSRPSAAEGWTIGDVVAHLSLALRFEGQVLTSAGTGRAERGLWKTVGELSRTVTPAVAPAFHAVNSALPKLIDKTLTREAILARFSNAAGSLREKLDGVLPADYTKQVTYVGGTWPLSFFLAAVLNELAIHRWDIEGTLDPHARLDDDARTVLPWFYWSGTPFMLRPPQGTHGTVQALVTEPDLEMWWSLSPGSKEQHMGRAESPDATISGESGTFVLSLAGRLKALDALRFGALQVTGKDELARSFLSSWHVV